MNKTEPIIDRNAAPGVAQTVLEAMEQNRKPKKHAAVKPAPSEKPHRASLDGEYPGLAGMTYCIGWLEQLLSILSEPLLIGCSALAVADFVTGGGLLKTFTWLAALWACSIAIAVSACFIVTWRRALRAFSQNRYVAGTFLVLLGCALGVVDWSAVATQSIEQSMHTNFAGALISLGFNVFWITTIRAGVTIAMAVVVAISNHAAVITAQAPKRRLAIFDRMLNQIAPVVSDQVEQAVNEQVERVVGIEQVPTNQAALPAPVKQSSVKHQNRLTVVNLKGDTEPLERVKRALEQKPECSDRELGRLADLAPATAKKYRLEVERKNEQVG